MACATISAKPYRHNQLQQVDVAIQELKQKMAQQNGI
jgi:hypothetical protein